MQPLALLYQFALFYRFALFRQLALFSTAVSFAVLPTFEIGALTMSPSRSLALAALALTPLLGRAQAPVQAGALHVDPDAVKEWTVPWERSGPRDPYVDQQGRVWFVGQRGNYIAYLDPGSGAFKQYQIDPGTYPHNLVVDRHNVVWYTGNMNGRIVKLDPATGKLTTYRMPDSTVRDPHTMTFNADGDAWFTAQGAGVVGKLTVADGEIKLWRLQKGSRPYGIVLDAKGRPWFDEFGTNKIGTIDPVTGELKEYTLPNERTRPRRIAMTSDGIIWYGDYTRGYLGRLDPATGKIEEFAMPSGPASLPYAMATDDQDRIWVAETGVQPNQLVAFDAKKRTWVATIPVGQRAPNTVRHMVFDKKTRQLWFGEDQNAIGRAKVPAASVVP
jgi:virginiamycin B lyase